MHRNNSDGLGGVKTIKSSLAGGNVQGESMLSHSRKNREALAAEARLPFASRVVHTARPLRCMRSAVADVEWRCSPVIQGLKLPRGNRGAL